MAYSPVAYIAPNYRDYGTYWLKAYTPATTTPKVMATDSGASSTVAKLQLNADGFFVSAAGALVIPHIEGSYDAYLFPTEAEADANNTSNAVIVADNVAVNTLPAGSLPVKESFALTTGQVSITFLNVNPSTAIIMVAGVEIDSGTLILADDYTFIGQTVQLLRTYPAGTELIAIDLVTSVKTDSSDNDVYVNVTDYGAYNNPALDVDQTVLFRAAAQAAASNRIVFIPAGAYLISSDVVTVTTWMLDPGALISGLGGVAPTFERDTTRLTGTVVDYSTPNAWNTIRIGDPAFTVQKITKKSFSAEFEANSDNAAGGLLGTTYSSARSTVDASRHAVAAVAVNNSNDITGVWAGYLETYILPNTNGNSFCMESTTFNANPTLNVVDTPNTTVIGRQGLTYNLWLTTGGDAAYAETMYDSTAAIGILGKAGTWGAKYDKGIICKEGSIESGEFCAIPSGLKYTWWDNKGAGDKLRTYIEGDSITSDGRFKIGLYDGASDSIKEVIFRKDSISPPDNEVTLGRDANRFSDVFTNSVNVNGVTWTAESGTPNGVVTAGVGSLYTNRIGSAGTTLWVKESGNGNTGWVAK